MNIIPTCLDDATVLILGRYYIVSAYREMDCTVGLSGYKYNQPEVDITIKTGHTLQVNESKGESDEFVLSGPAWCLRGRIGNWQAYPLRNDEGYPLKTRVHIVAYEVTFEKTEKARKEVT